MSFSLWVTVSHGDGYTTEFTIVDGQTYNLTPMWRLAGLLPESDKGTSQLGGRPCTDMQEPALKALVHYWQHRDEYEVLEPDNGWGDAEGFYEHGLLPLARRVHEHPTGVIGWAG